MRGQWSSRRRAPLYTKIEFKKTPFESDLYLRRRERRNSLPNQMWILKMKSQIRELVRRKFSIYRFGNMIRLEYLRANLYGKISVITHGQKLWSLTSVSLWSINFDRLWSLFTFKWYCFLQFHSIEQRFGIDGRSVISVDPWWQY